MATCPLKVVIHLLYSQENWLYSSGTIVSLGDSRVRRRLWHGSSPDSSSTG